MKVDFNFKIYAQPMNWDSSQMRARSIRCPAIRLHYLNHGFSDSLLVKKFRYKCWIFAIYNLMLN